MRRGTRSTLAALSCLLILQSGALAQDDFASKLPSEEKRWQAFFSAIEHPLLLDALWIGVPSGGYMRNGDVETIDPVIPIPLDYLNLWATAEGRKIVAIPGGYVLCRTRSSALFGTASKSHWIFAWLAGKSTDEIEALSLGIPAGDLDQRGQALLASWAGNASGGFGVLFKEGVSYQAQLKAEVQLTLNSTDGNYIPLTVVSHRLGKRLERSSGISPIPVPPFAPASSQPKSVIIDYKEGRLVTLQDIIVRLFEEAGIWIIPDRRHREEKVFVKGKWDSYALAEALKKYHEVEPMFVGDYEAEVDKFGDTFEDSFEKLARSADEDFKKLSEMAEAGQTLTWGQLQQDFTEIAKQWNFIEGQAPGPDTVITLDRYIRMNANSYAKGEDVHNGGFGMGYPKPRPAPKTGN